MPTQLATKGSRPSAATKIIAIMISTLAASIGVLTMSILASNAQIALSIVPFATSIALVAGAPRSAPASSRSILVGHLSSAIIGVVAVKFLGAGMLPGAFAVGIGVAVMLALKSLHPPAAISPLIICEYNLGPYFIVVPVLIGALLVVLLSRLTEILQRRFGCDLV
jgi:CBS-domain-containing membrane protein